MNSIFDSLGDADYLQEVCDELNFLGHVRAAFVIVQRFRFVPNEKFPWGPAPKRPNECLPDHRKQLRELFKELGLEEPSKADIVKAMSEYKMFSQTELAEMEKEIAI